MYVLVAIRDLLDRAGFRPVDRHEIVKEKSVEELNAQLVSLVGENGAIQNDLTPLTLRITEDSAKQLMISLIFTGISVIGLH